MHMAIHWSGILKLQLEDLDGIDMILMCCLDLAENYTLLGWEGGVHSPRGM